MSDTKPKIRFKGFTDPWEQRKVGDFLSISRIPGHTGVDAKKLTVKLWGKGVVEKDDSNKGSENTQYFIRTAGQFMYGKLDFLHAAFGIVPENLNNYESTLDLPAFDISGIDSQFLLNRVTQENFYLRYGMIANGSRKAKRIHEDVFLDMTLVVPKYKEQVYIGNLFKNLDNLITLHQRKCEMLQKTKKALLEKMFPQNGSAFPEVRFKGFTDPWEQRKLGELMNVTSVKRIHQSDWTTEGVRFLRARDIVSAAKNEEVDYLYISKQKYEEYSALSGKVSVGDLLVTGVGTIGIPLLIKNLEPVYFKDGNIIWFQNGEKIESDFFYYSFVAKAIQNFIKDSSGIGTVGTYTIENGKKTPIFLPEKAEQKAVGAFFTHLDHLITLHQRAYEALKQMKQALLQKMFV